MNSPDELARALSDIGLKAAAAMVNNLIDVPKKTTPYDTLAALVALERDERTRRSLERRHKRSRIGDFKVVDAFDWAFPKTIERHKVSRVLDLAFMKDGANVIFMGQHGVGKTMLTKNIAHQAVLRGHTVIFTTISRMLNDLTGTDSRRRLEARLKHYARVDLLIADELGYLAYDCAAADLLFEIVTRRHEARKPIVVTTNLAFKDWGTVFPHATCTVALVDRLTHRAEIIRIDGPSWRRKEAQERELPKVT